MNTTQNNKQKKENQIIFIEYEKPNEKGHLVTVMDSYRNIIGRIHRSYDKESKKYEFTAYNYAGKELFKNETLWKLKKEFTDQREKFLEAAHQRRIESKKVFVEKEVKTEKSEVKNEQTKQENRKKEIENLRQEKGEQKEIENDLRCIFHPMMAATQKHVLILPDGGNLGFRFPRQ